MKPLSDCADDLECVLEESADRLWDEDELALAMREARWTVTRSVTGWLVSRHAIAADEEYLWVAAEEWARLARSPAVPSWVPAMRAATTLPGSGVHW